MQALCTPDFTTFRSLHLCKACLTLDCTRAQVRQPDLQCNDNFALGRLAALFPLRKLLTALKQKYQFKSTTRNTQQVLHIVTQFSCNDFDKVIS